ncbi:hypothetical protein GGX14DRAFT_430097 [Mycena pura]|uniref:Uncharacterized protein n=1 Tax=Mycena pura TaxID=153505 RepID=A0AAD6YI53_9AGAR|nr:hypothetical protein GGX14DRAFT_430097 [Mycena pura]
MPPRRAKAKKAAAAPKRRAVDDASTLAPPAKKARQDASNDAPAKSVAQAVAAEAIELSSDEEQPAALAATLDVSNDSGSDETSDGGSKGGARNDASSEGGDDEDGNPPLPRKVRERLECIEMHTSYLTSTYLKMVTRELDGYMGGGGRNADVAASIVQHCAFQAHQCGSSLLHEKKLVQRVHRMCYGACGESDAENDEDSDDAYDEDYEIPKKISDRLVLCLHMLERFDVKALRKVIKKLPEYKGRRKGEQDDVLDDVMSHLDDMAAKKADIVAEAAMITKIKDKLEKA